MSKFAVVIHAEPAGGYWGEVPALPGCYSQEETVDELLANLREAIAGVLEVMQEEGRTLEENVQVVELAV
jgi:predicted RNase H-like HicB family nuclease